MTPLEHFMAVWNRCDQLCAIHAYVANNVSGALQPDELLRSEWVARVSALDLYVHELVCQRMLEVFEGTRSATPAYLKFRVSTETLSRIRIATLPSDGSAAFDLEIRNQLATVSYQHPDNIAEGIRLVSEIELWNEIALLQGATSSNKTNVAKTLRKDLALIVQRRNKIAHEGDLQPTAPRDPWPVNQADVAYVSTYIETLVHNIDTLI